MSPFRCMCCTLCKITLFLLVTLITSSAVGIMMVVVINVFYSFFESYPNRASFFAIVAVHRLQNVFRATRHTWYNGNVVIQQEWSQWTSLEVNTMGASVYSSS